MATVQSGSWCGLVVVLLAFCAGGCRSAMGRGIQAYQVGRYPEAIEALLAAEPDERNHAPERCARYALYRGLTHLALGDQESAARWLAEAKTFDDRHPRKLSDAEHGQLLAGWLALGHKPGDWGWQALQKAGWHQGS